MDSRSNAKQLLKQGCHLLNAGEPERALRFMHLAYGETSDYGDETEAAYYLPRIRHGLALVHAELGNSELAETNFTLSLKLFDKSNHVGRAWTLRDYGWFLYAVGDLVKGMHRIRGALAELEKDNERDERWKREHATTEGFLARMDAHRSRHSSLAKLREVDRVLRGGDKWIYELDNLRFLISLAPFAESIGYRARAVWLRERICMTEDMKVLTSDIVMGRPVHGISRLMVRSTRRRIPF